MSLNKAIASGKEHRVQYGTKNQPYCKSVDSRCRNHGGRSGGAANHCIWCLGNKLNKYKILDKISKKELKDFNI